MVDLRDRHAEGWRCIVPGSRLLVSELGFSGGHGCFHFDDGRSGDAPEDWRSAEEVNSRADYAGALRLDLLGFDTLRLAFSSGAK